MNQRNPELFTQRATEYELESSLPYLLNRAGTRIGLTFNEDVARYRLTVPAWRVLASLYTRAEQTVSELAAHTSIELSSVSRLAAELAQRGLVTRSPSGADGRAIQLSLTPAGLDVTAQIIPVAQLYERIALAGIDPEEVASLKRILAKIYDNIAALAPRETARKSSKSNKPNKTRSSIHGVKA